jgi:hypothetical protein
MRPKAKALARFVLPALGLWLCGAGASELSGQEIAVPAPAGSRQHHLATTRDDGLLLSWVEGSNSSPSLRFAIRRNGHWSQPSTIATERRLLAAAPVVIGLSDGGLAAAWMIHVDDPEDRYAAEIFLSRSQDEGSHWSKAEHPYPASARIYDAQMSLAPLDQGRAALLWTDSRRRKSADRYQLMAAVIDRNGKAGPETTVDEDVCSCCETGLAAQGDDWLAVYRDHLQGEVRDIALARSQAGKLEKRSVHEDHWVIAGCPSNGPAVDWRGSRAAVAWCTLADGVGRVKLAFSQDGGKSVIEPPLELDANANGYVNVLLLDDGSALAVWRGRAGPEEELRLARVHPGGRIDGRATLLRGEFPPWPSRHIGLARAGKEIYVAWTDSASSKVRMFTLPVPEGAGSP